MKNKLLPPGFDYSKQLNQFIVLLLVCVLVPFVVANGTYLNQIKEIKEAFGTHVPQYSAYKIYTISEYMAGVAAGEFVYVLFGINKAIEYYRSYFKESKSIYLMKRLSDKTLIYKSVLTLPLVFIGFSIVMTAFIWLLFTLIYNSNTPVELLNIFVMMGGLL